MFFLLAKVLGFFALPSNLFVLIGLIGIFVLPRRFMRTRRTLVVASVLLLAICGLTPIGNALIAPLEQRFPPWDAARGAPDGIIVLGGAFDISVSEDRGEPVLNDAAERLTVVADLARRFPAARIVFSGGSGRYSFDGMSEAEAAGRMFETFGIAKERMTLEDRSRDTAENALFTKMVAAPKPGERWLLVTSAHHMPRAMGVFRRVGLVVEPYPVDWRTRGWQDVWRPFYSVGDGLKRTDTAVREWIGLFVYWMTGRSSDLFPGPVTAGCDLAGAPDSCRPQ